MTRECTLPDYINKLTLKLRPGMVFGLNDSKTAVLVRGRSPGEWMLKHGGRVRWGNSTEIQQDIDHFETFGKLPDRTIGGF